MGFSISTFIPYDDDVYIGIGNGLDFAHSKHFAVRRKCMGKSSGLDFAHWQKLRLKENAPENSRQNKSSNSEATFF